MGQAKVGKVQMVKEGGNQLGCWRQGHTYPPEVPVEGLYNGLRSILGAGDERPCLLPPHPYLEASNLRKLVNGDLENTTRTLPYRGLVPCALGV